LALLPQRQANLQASGLQVTENAANLGEKTYETAHNYASWEKPSLGGSFSWQQQ
jgi:hypothetical protein